MPKPVSSSLLPATSSADTSCEELDTCVLPGGAEPANACASLTRTDEDEPSPGVEILTAKFSIKNDQLEASVGVPSLTAQTTVGGMHLSGELDYVTANLHLGSQNSDGSKGENIGAMATGLGLEATAEYSGWSLTAGLSLSAGASISSGAGRDVDHDGRPERCFQVSFGPLTLGECDEF